jgi:HSP20 family molecular chaperone IbpA
MYYYKGDCMMYNCNEEFFNGLPSFFNLFMFDQVTFDAKEEDNQYVYTIDLPGYDKEDLELSYLEENGKSYIVLHLKKEHRNKKVGKYKIGITNNIVIENIKSSLKNGILKIVISKKASIRNNIVIE